MLIFTLEGKSNTNGINNINPVSLNSASIKGLFHLSFFMTSHIFSSFHIIKISAKE